MTPRERAIAALTMKIPDQVPHFELEFQLGMEMFGKVLAPHDLRPANIGKLSAADRDKKLNQLAEDLVYVYESLDYCSMPAPYLGYVRSDGIAPELEFMIKKMLELTGGRRMIHSHADGTFALPDGNQMYEFSYRLADDPKGVHAEAKRKMEDAILRNKRLLDAGVEVGVMCDDYCYNTGPFISPDMFGEFIQPYLAKIIDEGKKMGMYMIKHTDGNIMPILGQLAACEPHALHSIDPMAGVDIKVVKELIGDKICLVGNVNCALMQTGTDEEVIASAKYCMTHGKPGGGYIFSTSNVPFQGMPHKRYEMILDIWKEMRDY
ncbi:MAG: hypothetical protein FWC77_00815 [Defluviitaleaceae bacterium]|nr:hypothetical protein [Defluviitaleaceae bacterium]